jgi:L-iditol 2-dehydrogenase
MLLMLSVSKAAVMSKPGEIKVRTFSLPKISDDSALIKMELSGICGTDLHIYRGEPPLDIYRKKRIEPIPFPIIPGHENVGVISEIGEDFAKKMEIRGIKLKEGDRIVPVCNVYCGKCYMCRHSYGYPWCENIEGYGITLSCKNPPHLFGGWAEYMYLLPNVFVFKVPQDITPEIAVLTEPLAVAIAAFTKAYLPTVAVDIGGFGIGSDVIIQGLGPIGVLHAFIARIVGVSNIIMVGTGSSSDLFRAELIEKFKIADNIVNEVTPEKRVKEALKFINGADVVIECTGAPEAVKEGLRMLRSGGTYLLVGMFANIGEVSINPTLHIVGKGAHIIGINGAPYQDYGRALTILEKYKDKMPFNKIVTHKFNLIDIKNAIEKALSKYCLKVVILP